MTVIYFAMQSLLELTNDLSKPLGVSPCCVRPLKNSREDAGVHRDDGMEPQRLGA